MKERQLMRAWTTAYKERHRDAFVHRIVENQVGIRPFDVLILHRGESSAWEFKCWRKKRPPAPRDAAKLLTRHQAHFLSEFTRAGGRSWIVVFYKARGRIFEMEVPYTRSSVSRAAAS